MSFEEQEKKIKDLRNKVILQDLEDLATIKGDGTARKDLINEVDILMKQCNEEYKAEMNAWNDEERRRIEEARNAEELKVKKGQNRAEVLRSTLDFTKGVGCSLIGAGVTFNAMKWIYKYEKDGIMPNSRALTMLLPKIKLW